MIKRILDCIHMVMHLLIGISISQIVSLFHPEFGGVEYFLLPAIIGSFLPDADHLLYFFTYGRKNPYSKKVRQLLKKGDIMGVIYYCAIHHKKLTGLYSHSILSMVLFLVLGLIMGLLQYWWWSVMLLGITFHFLFDMLEDILLLGRLNKNWLGVYSHN